MITHPFMKRQRQKIGDGDVGGGEEAVDRLAAVNVRVGFGVGRPVGVSNFGEFYIVLAQSSCNRTPEDMFVCIHTQNNAIPRFTPPAKLG
jgi:hypothetical protein